MNAQRIGSLAVPVPLVILALLAVADGITTHIGLVLGATEVNPLLAALYAVHPLVGESFRVGMWIAVLTFLWWAQPACGRRWWYFWVGIGITGMMALVAWNTVQLLRWWLLP